MRAKELMENVRKAESELELIEAKRRHYLALGGVSSSWVTGMPSGGHDGQSRVETAGVMMAELALELDRKSAEYQQMILGAEKLVEQIDQINFRKVLTYHYFLGYPMPEVGSMMGYKDDKSVYRARSYALTALDKIMST